MRPSGHSAYELALLLLIVASAFSLRCAMAVVIPARQAPDERAHFHYVVHLAEHATRPALPPRSLDMWQSEAAQAYQPPLAYLTFVPVCVALMRAGTSMDRVLEVLRCQNGLYGCAVVLLGYLCACLLTPRGDPRRLLVAAVLAFTPGFVGTSSVLNNDGLCNALVAGFWLLLVGSDRVAVEERSARRAVACGIALGTACLAKLTALVLAPLLLVEPLARDRSTSVAALRFAAIASVCSAAVLAPWCIDNWRVYGSPLPVGAGSLSFEWLRTMLPAEVVDPSSKAAPLKALLQFWGRFGIYNNLRWTVIPWVLGPLTAAAALGWITPRTGSRSASMSRLIPVLLVGIGLAAAGLVHFSLRYYGGWQGRYLYTAMVPVSLLLVEGWHRLVPGRWFAGFACLVAVALLTVDVVLLFKLHHFFRVASASVWGMATAL